jgi:hypothetical protein
MFCKKINFIIKIEFDKKDPSLINYNINLSNNFKDFYFIKLILIF